MATVRAKPTGPSRRPMCTVAMPPDAISVVERVTPKHARQRWRQCPHRLRAYQSECRGAESALIFERLPVRADGGLVRKERRACRLAQLALELKSGSTSAKRTFGARR